MATISGCGGGCTDSKNFPGQCNYNGIDATSCQAAKDIYNKKKPAGTISKTTTSPNRFTNDALKLGEQLSKKSPIKAKIDASTGVTPGLGGSIGTTITNIPKAIGNALPLSPTIPDVSGMFGLPGKVMGIDTDIVILGGVIGALILILVIK